MVKQSKPMNSKKMSLFAVALMPVLGAALIMDTGIVPTDAEACGFHRYRSRDPKPSMTKIGNRWQVKLGFTRKYYSFRGGNYRLQNLTVFTRDKQLATFLKEQGASNNFWSAFRKVAQRRSCVDLQTGRKLVKLERELAGGIAAFYKAKTRRRAGRMDLMVGLYPYSSMHCKPPAPAGRPPRAKRRRP